MNYISRKEEGKSEEIYKDSFPIKKLTAVRGKVRFSFFFAFSFLLYGCNVECKLLSRKLFYTLL